MAFFITLQILFDLAVVGYVIWSHFYKEAESVTDSWKKEWEAEKQNYEQQVAMQLRSMRLLTEQTKKLMEEKSWAMTAFPVSQEETELKQMVSEKTAGAIPTLTEFETQKERLKHETPLDLKTLLSEQLC